MACSKGSLRYYGRVDSMLHLCFLFFCLEFCDQITCCILQDHQCRAVSNICSGNMLLKAGSVVMLVKLEKKPWKK